MAQRFLSLDEAAQQLGVAKEKLNELREAGRARAFRDGSSWKFKESEVERLAADGIAELIGELEGAVEGAGDAAASAQSDADPGEFDLSLDDDVAAGDSGAVLLSELELGEDASEGSSSTIIGKEGEAAKPDSDLEISSEVGGSEISDLAIDAGSDLALDDEAVDPLTGDESNVLSPNAGGSGVLHNEPEPAAKFEQLEELDLDLNSSQLSFADDSVAGKLEPPPQGGEQDSSAEPPPRGESSIKLATDEDDEVVLGGDSSGDITVDSQHSGISLVDSADTGISLDQAPADLGSSAGGSSVESFDLSGDESFTLTDQPTADSGSGLQEGSFVLPASDGGSGSSSQIAFDLDSGVSENTATILGSEPSLGSGLDMGGAEPPAPMLEEEPVAADLEGVGVTAATGAVTMSAAVREAQYTGWNIAFLSLCAVLLLLSGAMMFDLLRSMWSWNEPYSLNSGIMDAILNALF